MSYISRNTGVRLNAESGLEFWLLVAEIIQNHQPFPRAAKLLEKGSVIFDFVEVEAPERRNFLEPPRLESDT